MIPSANRMARSLRYGKESMSQLSAREAAVARNYSFFERKLPELLPHENGKYALLHDEKLISIFDTASGAMRAGTDRFDDGLFSVQKVEESSINLGYFSYARYSRVA